MFCLCQIISTWCCCFQCCILRESYCPIIYQLACVVRLSEICLRPSKSTEKVLECCKWTDTISCDSQLDIEMWHQARPAYWSAHVRVLWLDEHPRKSVLQTPGRWRMPSLPCCTEPLAPGQSGQRCESHVSDSSSPSDVIVGCIRTYQDEEFTDHPKLCLIPPHIPVPEIKTKTLWQTPDTHGFFFCVCTLLLYLLWIATLHNNLFQRFNDGWFCLPKEKYSTHGMGMYLYNLLSSMNPRAAAFHLGTESSDVFIYNIYNLKQGCPTVAKKPWPNGKHVSASI